MSDWYGEFQAAFFDEWVKAGLPAPRSPGPSPLVIDTSACLSESIRREVAGLEERALSPNVLGDVYSFGMLIGRSFAELFGINASVAKERADWCGRFNLGISLFDYVCDELADDPKASIAALPAFAPFTGVNAALEVSPANVVGGFLDRLAGGLLDELTEKLGPPTRSRRRTGLWGALDRMFAAELTVATTAPALGADLATIRKLLRTKSSEPFRVMAEWVARGGARISVRRAGGLGRALGDCFWLSDDGRDVWKDLDAGRWNLFLVAAAEHDTGLVFERQNPVLEAHLLRQWRHHDVARRTARMQVRRLASGLLKLGAPAPTVAACGQRFSDAMATWNR
jgi:hypothetical protein